MEFGRFSDDDRADDIIQNGNDDTLGVPKYRQIRITSYNVCYTKLLRFVLSELKKGNRV